MWFQTKIVGLLAAFNILGSSLSADAASPQDAGVPNTGPPLPVVRHAAPISNDHGDAAKAGNVLYSRKRLREMIRQARTAEDHERLAAYFRAKANVFRAQQDQDRQALAEYLANPGKYPSKYPTRGDVARGMAAYYGIQARDNSVRASKHEEMAAKLRGNNDHQALPAVQ